MIPTLSEQGLAGPTEASQVGSYSLDSGAIMDQTTCQNKQPNTDLVQDMSSDDKVKSRRLKKTNNNLTRGMSSNVPKKSSGYKKYMCFGFLH